LTLDLSSGHTEPLRQLDSFSRFPKTGPGDQDLFNSCSSSSGDDGFDVGRVLLAGVICALKHRVSQVDGDI